MNKKLQELQIKLTIWNKAMREIGMKVNNDKTKVMIGQNNENLNIEIVGENIEQAGIPLPISRSKD